MKTSDEKIIFMYTDKLMSTYEIASKLETYPNKITRTLKKHGIELRDKSQAQKLALDQGRCKHPTAGKERSLEERVKISSGLVSYWDSITKDERKRRSDQAKERWNKMSASQKDRMSQLATAAIRLAGKEGSKLENFIGDKIQEYETLDELFTAKVEEGTYAALCGNRRIFSSIQEPVRGLVIDDLNERWGFEEMAQWLNGKKQNSKKHTPTRKATKPYNFMDKNYQNPRILAYAFTKNVKEAAIAIKDEALENWIRKTLERMI